MTLSVLKVMKKVDVAFKRLDVVDYFPQLDEIKVKLLFDDGQEQTSVKQFSITDPQAQAREWFGEVRALLKKRHQPDSLDDDPLANVLVLRFKQEEDVLQDKLARFLAQAREKIRSAKLAKLSYYDLNRKMKAYQVEF